MADENINAYIDGSRMLTEIGEVVVSESVYTIMHSELAELGSEQEWTDLITAAYTAGCAKHRSLLVDAIRETFDMADIDKMVELFASKFFDRLAQSEFKLDAALSKFQAAVGNDINEQAEAFIASRKKPNLDS